MGGRLGCRFAGRKLDALLPRHALRGTSNRRGIRTALLVSHYKRLGRARWRTRGGAEAERKWLAVRSAATVPRRYELVPSGR